MSTVLIRADSSFEIGTGHIMRDLVLAEREFAKARVIFAVRDLPGHITHKIVEAGYETIELQSNGIEELAEAAKRVGAKTIVIDHYGIGYEEERRLKELTGATLFVLDDTYNRHFCDILLNHNVFAEADRYEGLVPKTCEVRCGRSYMLIRKEFYEAKRAAKRGRGGSPFRVFLAMGGADTAGLNLPVLRLLERFEDIAVDVVTTRANARLRELLAYAEGRKNVRVYVETSEMAKLLAKADLAIVTPSVTLNEVLFMEVPFIAIETASNQRMMSRYLQKAGLPVLRTFQKEAFLRLFQREMERSQASRTGGNDEDRLRIGVLTSPNQWFVPYAKKLADFFGGARVLFDHEAIEEGFDILFILSYHRIVPPEYLRKNGHNIVVHASDLPKGKGWAPMFWQILEGKNEIPFTLFEAADGVDNGDVYMKRTLKLDGYELNAELRRKQAEFILKMCQEFVKERIYLQKPLPQEGEESFYPKRTPEDSRLDPDKTLREQFNLLRIVDNDAYPAFFEIDGHRYVLKIEKEES